MLIININSNSSFSIHLSTFCIQSVSVDSDGAIKTLLSSYTIKVAHKVTIHDNSSYVFVRYLSRERKLGGRLVAKAGHSD